jgi:site-specific DNA-cytosine methylase
MKVLVACEESQEVCKAFRAKGHEAYSCDLIEPSGGHPEWHILGDCLKAIDGGQVVTMDGIAHDVPRWDMIIAFVPCTKTSNAGARHLYKGGKLNLYRYYEGLCGKALFLAVWAADCEKVVIENPTPSKIFDSPFFHRLELLTDKIDRLRRICGGMAVDHLEVDFCTFSQSHKHL